MTQVEMAKPIMGWDYFFCKKTVAEKYGGGIKLSNSEKYRWGEGRNIFFLSSQETS